MPHPRSPPGRLHCLHYVHCVHCVHFVQIQIARIALSSVSTHIALSAVLTENVFSGQQDKGKWRQEENIAFIFAIFNELQVLRYILIFRHIFGQ